MSLLLNVPFAEKDEAKSLGARWNADFKKWYVANKKDYHKFIKWILGNNDTTQIICDHFYIIEGVHECFKCHTKIKVIGFGIENFFDICDPNEYDTDNPFDYYEGEIHISSMIDPLPENFKEYLSSQYNYRTGFSKTVNSRYPANHCKNCNVIQGEFFLFQEVYTPFFIDSPEKAKELSLYKIKLNNDFIADTSMGYGSEDWLIKKHGKIVDFNFDFGF